MKLGFSKLEAMLRHMHAAPAGGAFRARLRNLQRVGLALAPLEGSGRKENYSFGSVVKLAVAVELLQAGLPPERAAILTTLNWPAAARVFVRLATGASRPAAYYLICEPAVVTGGGSPRFKFVEPDKLAECAAGRERLIVVNLVSLVVRADAAWVAAGFDLKDVQAELKLAAATPEPELPSSSFIDVEEL